MSAAISPTLAAAMQRLRRHAWTVAAFSGAANLLMLAPTVYMLQVYDRVLVSQSTMTLLVVSLATLFLLVWMTVAEVLRASLLVRIGVEMDEQLSPQVFAAQLEAQRLQPQAVGSNALADLIELRQFLTGHGAIALLDVIWTPIFMAVLFLLHPWLGAVGCAFALVQASLAHWGHRRAVLPMKHMQEGLRDSTQLLAQQLRHVEASHAMGLWPRLEARWRQAHESYLDRHADSHRATHRLQAWSKWLRYSQQSLSLAAGAWLVILGEISPGAMIAANVLMVRALTPLDQLVGLWRPWLSALQAYRRLQQLLAAHPRAADPPRPEAPRAVDGQLELRGVSACAPGQAADILHELDLLVPAGSVTVVMGPSGSGKSTLTRLLLGIWPARQGKVLLDGRALETWDRQALGPSVGYLPQSVELFSGTVADNIARHGEVDGQAVVEAAQLAGLHALILKMPLGYDTPVGESGEQLSGGQRQRIGLARALYGHPRVVVLDEPNAHLDDQGELALAQAVQAMTSRGQTVVLVSHRPGVVALADQIVLMCAGRIQWAGDRDAAQRMWQAGSSGIPASSTLATLSSHHA